MSSPGREVPTIKGGPVVRSLVLLSGVFVFAFGIVLMVRSELGLAPWDVLHQGLAEHTSLSIGTANTAVAVVVVLVAWRLGARIGPGTLANAILIGVFVDLLLRVDAIRSLAAAGIVERSGLLVAGIALIGIATALYIGAGLGAGARDSLMLVLTQRSGQRIGAVRSSIEAGAATVGFVLGGTVGVGTLAFVLGIGPAVEASFVLLARTPLVVDDQPRAPEAVERAVSLPTLEEAP